MVPLRARRVPARRLRPRRPLGPRGHRGGAGARGRRSRRPPGSHRRPVDPHPGRQGAADRGHRLGRPGSGRAAHPGVRTRVHAADGRARPRRDEPARPAHRTAEPDDVQLPPLVRPRSAQRHRSARGGHGRRPRPVPVDQREPRPRRRRRGARRGGEAPHPSDAAPGRRRPLRQRRVPRAARGGRRRGRRRRYRPLAARRAGAADRDLSRRGHHRRQHRCRRRRGRGRRGRPRGQRRHRALEGEAQGRAPARGLPRVDATGPDQWDPHRDVAAPRARPRRVRGALPAGGGDHRPPAGRTRGARAVAPPHPGPAAPGRVHPAGRADRSRGPARPVGAEPGLRGLRPVAQRRRHRGARRAGRRGGGEPFRSPDRRSRHLRHGPLGAGRHRHRPVGRGPRDHRERARWTTPSRRCGCFAG